MCNFLQHQVWHEESQSAMKGLTKTSSKVVETLKSSSKLQDDIIKNQMETLDYQKKISEHGSILSQTVEQSRLAANQMMSELRASTDEQKTLIFSIFDRVTKLQSLLLSEVSWLYTVLFYSGCLLAVYLATATKRTADARLWLFMLISVNVGLERLICTWTVSGKEELDPFTIYQNDESTPEALLHYRIWIARKITLFISVVLLCYKALTFQDYNIINYQLLRDIQKQNADLCRTVKILQSGAAVTNETDVVDANEDEEADDEASESDISFDSRMTDSTWMLNDFSDDEDTDVIEDESFDVSLNTTPINNNDDSNVTEIVPFNHEVMNSFETKPPVLKKRGRPSGSRNNSRSATPLGLNHTYNLRQRKPNKSYINPMLEEESPDNFGRLVNAYANESKAHRKEIINQLKTNPNATINVLSDDAQWSEIFAKSVVSFGYLLNTNKRSFVLSKESNFE